MSTVVPIRGWALFSLLGIMTAMTAARALGKDPEPPDGPIAIAKPDWLEGSGKELRIRIAGELRDERGDPLNDCRVRITLRTQHWQTKVLARVEQNRFRASIPVGEVGWYCLHVQAVSKDGRRMARADIPAFQLRQLAIDGLNLTLRPPERTVQVTVVENGKPVSKAHVAGEIGGATFDAQTDDAGIVRFPFMNRDKLSQLTAWTDDFKIGGFSFHRMPPRDPSGKEFTIELERCRPQTIRLISDDDKMPVPGLDFVLTVGTGQPDFQFPGHTPECRMRTDDKGEAVYRWFPDWERHGSYIESLNPHWVKAESQETVGGTMVVRLKKSRLANRKRVVGRVDSTGSNVAGLSVEMWSFQGEEERHSDALYAVTDENGRFAGDFLPGATYCIFVNDARYVSNIIDLMPYDPATDETNSPALTLQEEKPVDVIVTSGPLNTPVPYQWISLQTPHPYDWLENGETRSGLGSRRWSVITDAEGRARTYALPGHTLQGSIYTHELRAEAKVDVREEGATKLEFHLNAGE